MTDEKELSRVQAEIDAMQGRLNAMRAHVEYARAEVWLRRKRVLGPLGLVCKGLWWGVGKLFVIRG